MSYFASVTFDISEGDAQDYQTIYSGLSQIGFKTQLTGSNGRTFTLPTTTCAGEFTSTSAAAARDALTKRVEQLFVANGLTGEVFVSVGGDWAWAHRTPNSKRTASLDALLGVMNR